MIRWRGVNGWEMMSDGLFQRTAARLSLGLTVAFLTLLAALHVLEPEFNSGHLFSEYQLDDHGYLMSLAFCLLGASLFLLPSRSGLDFAREAGALAGGGCTLSAWLSLSRASFLRSSRPPSPATCTAHPDSLPFSRHRLCSPSSEELLPATRGGFYCHSAWDGRRFWLGAASCCFSLPYCRQPNRSIGQAVAILGESIKQISDRDLLHLVADRCVDLDAEATVPDGILDRSRPAPPSRQKVPVRPSEDKRNRRQCWSPFGNW